MSVSSVITVPEPTFGTAAANKSYVDSEITSADAALQSNIAAEATARSNADGVLQSSIDAEVNARTAADVTLQGNIDAEASSRSAADVTLQSNIDALQTSIAAQAWSYKGSATCSFVNGYLVLDESDLSGGSETITVYGADLDQASTFALANEGNSLTLSTLVAGGSSLTFDLSHAQAAALTGCTGDLYLHLNLIIDGRNSGLTLFVRIQA